MTYLSNLLALQNQTNRLSLTSLVITAAMLSLTGCATTQNFSTQHCQASNWQALGYADGIRGRSGAYFGRYSKSCAGVVGTTATRILWEQGRKQGLTHYCTELNAYKIGREGYDWQPVCPLEGIDKLENAYAQGRYYYQRQRDFDALHTPYPFGYGYRHFGYRPFGGGW